MTDVPKTSKAPPTLTLFNHVARLRSEAYPSWVNACHHHRTPETAFEAGIRAALSDRPEATAARRYVDAQPKTSLPWNEGAKEDAFERGKITMSHDELEAALGDVAKLIADAGFVLVPRVWREQVFTALEKRAAS